MNSLTHGGSGGARRFPDGFVWGVGTSSYQIEGAVDADGRGRSIWDVFAHTPGKVNRGDTGDIACNSYNRLEDDVRLLSELGVGAYRFSVSWPRVLPSGSGTVNQPGLDYYRRLVERLNQNGIRPVVTVYHWDLPRRSRSAAAGPIATRRCIWASSRRSSPRRSAIRRRCGSRPTSRCRPCSRATSPEPMPQATATPSLRPPRFTTSCWGTDMRSRRFARSCRTRLSARRWTRSRSTRSMRTRCRRAGARR